jgi:hypothetical protein
MRHAARQRGGVKLETVVWLTVMVIVAMICWKAVPVKIATAEFYDHMEEQAKWAANASNEAIKKEILRKAQELQLPITDKMVKVTREGDNIRMKADYTIPLEFPFYTYNWDFHHEIFRPVFNI